MRRLPTVPVLVTASVAALALVACEKAAAPAAAVDAGAAAADAGTAAAPAGGPAARPAFMASFTALPERPAVENADLVRLGQMLYFEKRISKSHEISCNSCHDLARFGVDNEPTSPGHKGQRGGRNSPTTLNAALHTSQFWDGRAKDVEEQAKGPVLNPIEMAMADEGSVLKTLQSMPEYVELFAKAFPGEAKPLSYDNFGRAVGAFERQLITPSRLDAYLKGDDKALTAEELAGAQKFVETGCTACHGGATLGGLTYMKIGAVRPAEGLKEDMGRFEVTKLESDKLFFKVPSLRNVEKTAPYFHDGSVASLEEAVKKMASWQLGKDLTDADVASIVRFLKALTGTVPAELAQAPELPKSTPKTPKPVAN